MGDNEQQKAAMSQLDDLPMEAEEEHSSTRRAASPPIDPPETGPMEPSPEAERAPDCARTHAAPDIERHEEDQT